jgi:carboxymethylenebutenolidase
MRAREPRNHGADIALVVAAVRARPDSNGKVGAVGFCWGGAAVNNLAVADPTLNAAVAYYGRQPSDDKVPAIKAPLLLHYAGIDENVNKGIAGYEAALKANGKSFELFTYDGANHAFNDDTAGVRYNKEAAELAWQRTIAFFREHLGAPPRAS